MARVSAEDDPYQWPALTGQVPVRVEPPMCTNHREVQHRDRRGPWCNTCGWTHGRAGVPASRVRP